MWIGDSQTPSPLRLMNSLDLKRQCSCTWKYRNCGSSDLAQFEKVPHCGFSLLKSITRQVFNYLGVYKIAVDMPS